MCTDCTKTSVFAVVFKETNTARCNTCEMKFRNKWTEVPNNKMDSEDGEIEVIREMITDSSETEIIINKNKNGDLSMNVVMDETVVEENKDTSSIKYRNKWQLMSKELSSQEMF